jgi:hypothetical protein
VGTPNVSVNDEAFPFATTLWGTAYDPGDAALTFSWYNGSVLVSAGDTTVVSGTYTNHLVVENVTAGTTLTQYIIDANGGTTTLDYGLRGYAPAGLTGGGALVSSTILPTTNTLPVTIIGPGQEVVFTAYASDTSPGQLQFDWAAGTNEGWGTNFSETDLPAPLPNGSYRSQIVRSAGTVETPGQHFADCTVTNGATGQSLFIRNSVLLEADTAPGIVNISCDASGSGPFPLPNTGAVHFYGTAGDADNLVLSYRWDFTVPNGVTLWGSAILFRPDQYAIFSQAALSTSGPVAILGQLTVSDRYGLSSTVNIQSFVTVQVWPS